MKRKIGEMADFIRENKYNIYSVTEILDGVPETVEINEAPYSTDVYSVSKFVSMCCVGLLYDEGKISPDDKITELIKDCPGPAEKKWKDVTVGNCLNHKTGLTEGNLDIDSSSYNGSITDWLTYILALPINGPRGEYRHYTDAAYYLLLRAVESVSGESPFGLIHRRLLAPLGFRECSWSVCPEGHAVGGSGFCANDRDLAKLAQLWLDEGEYGGVRYFSEEWVRLTKENAYGVDERNEYPGFYFKTGANGQMLAFIPAEKRVIAVRGYYSSDERTVLFDKFFTD